MSRLVLLGFLGLACFAACNGTADVGTIGGYSFDAPDGWQHKEWSARDQLTSEWTPSDGNPRKESITIIVTERSPLVAATDDGTIERLLAQAQAGLRGHASEPTPIKNAYDLRGSRIDVEYVPPGLQATYHRVHIVLASGTALIHLLYTVKDANAPQEAFNRVVSTFHRGEG